MIDRSPSAQPLYRQIKRKIEAMIASGQYDHGVPLTPETELAKQYGVSVMTVRQAFGELVAEKRLYRVPGKGTFVVPGRKKVIDIGFVFRDAAEVEHPFFSGLIQGVRSELADREVENTLFISEFQNDVFVRNLVQTDRVHGLIITGQEMDERDLYRWLGCGVPFVLLFYPFPVEVISRVYVDFEAETCKLVNYLIELGHRNIALLHGPWEWEIERQKFRGFGKAMHQLGPGNVIAQETVFDSARSSVAARKLLEEHPEVTAVVCSDDLIAVNCIKVAQSMGRDVPGDLDVVGFGDYDMASLFSPSITTMKIPLDRIGRIGAELVYNAILDKDYKPQEVKVDLELIVRESAQERR